MKPNPVGWFEIYVNDLNRAQKFYETVFDCKLENLPTNVDGFQMLAFPMDRTSTGAAGVLAKMEGLKAGGGSVIVYFTSPDCSLQEKRIPAAGGSVHKPKTSIGEYGYIVLAGDTEGNMFGIHSRD
jgi:hypothetical protein